MVRGLDYYTKTTFEFVHAGLGAQSAIGGGGRYDGLMAELGGQPLSGHRVRARRRPHAAGLPGRGDAPWSAARCDVFGVPLGDGGETPRWSCWPRSCAASGCAVDLAYGGRGLKGAMKAADRSGARFALVLGERDLQAGEVGLKDLATGEQRSVALAAAVAEVAARVRG